MNWIAVLLGGIVAATHYGYSFADDPQGYFYVLRGIEGAIAFGLLGLYFRKNLAVLAVCVWGVFEEVQTALCGYADLIPSPDSGMCLELVGPFPYAAIGAAAIVYLLIRKKNARED